MQRATAEKKDLLNLSETIEYFNLRSKKCFILLSEKKRFMILLFSMAVEDLIIRTAFERYILKHPELRRCR